METKYPIFALNFRFEMRFLLCFLLLTFPFFSYKSEAQQLKMVPLNFSSEYSQTTKSSVFSLRGCSQVELKNINIERNIPKGAIFCRMEDAIYKKLNFWFKFRMGTDDKYSN